MSSSSSTAAAVPLLTPVQVYAAGSLFALALRQAQIHQTRPLGSLEDGDSPAPDRCSSDSSGASSDSNGPELWIHESCGLLRPVFSLLEIDPKAWNGIEETAASNPSDHHVGALLRMIFEEDTEASPESLEQKLALVKAVDAMAMSLEAASSSTEVAREERREYEHLCRKRSSLKQDNEEGDASKISDSLDEFNFKISTSNHEPADIKRDRALFDRVADNSHFKVCVLFELLSACIADSTEEKKHSGLRKGYDARHRVALRLLATWFDVAWRKVVC